MLKENLILPDRLPGVFAKAAALAISLLMLFNSFLVFNSQNIDIENTCSVQISAFSTVFFVSGVLTKMSVAVSDKLTGEKSGNKPVQQEKKEKTAYPVVNMPESQSKNSQFIIQKNTDFALLNKNTRLERNYFDNVFAFAGAVIYFLAMLINYSSDKSPEESAVTFYDGYKYYKTF